MKHTSPTAGDIVALLIMLVGLGIGSLCYWAMYKGYIVTGGGIAGMVIGGLIALPPLLFWNIDTQRWQVTFRIEPTDKEQHK